MANSPADPALTADPGAALRTLSSAVSHDLRAPVGQIQLYAELLLETHGDAIPAGCADGLRTIASEAARICAMTDGILSLTRISQRTPLREMVDLVPIAQAIAHECSVRWPHAVEFIAPASLVVSMDAAMAHALLEQLLDNAWKFSQGQPAPQVELGLISRDHAGGVTCVLRDNGTGFDDTSPAAGRLFTPFKRMPEAAAYPGTGIGLATVAWIARAHGGSCQIRSQPDRGSAVTIFIGPS